MKRVIKKSTRKSSLFGRIYHFFTLLFVLAIVILGFFIYTLTLTKADVATVKTATYTIQATDDIANQISKQVILPLQSNSDPWIGNGGQTSDTILGMRFHGVAIPKGSIIHSAIVEVSPSADAWIGVSVSISAENNLSPQPYSVTNGPFGRSETSQKANYNKNEKWLKGQYYSLDATVPVADLIQHTGTDGVISLTFLGTGSPYGRKFIHAATSTSFSPRLTIVYQTESSSTVPAYVSEQSIPAQFTVPSTIRAVDFMSGQEGTAYHDTEPENKGNFYRNTGVDIKQISSESVVGWGRIGEWLQYTIRVPESSQYTLSVRGGSIYDGRSVAITIDGTAVTSINIPKIADWGQYASVNSQPFSISAGTHIVRVTIGNQDWVDIASFTFNDSVSSATITPIPSNPVSSPKPTSSGVQPTSQPLPGQQTLFVSPTGQDINDGSQTRPLKTITKAISVANGLSSPVKIKLLIGVYREELIFKNLKRSANAPITIEGSGPQSIISGAESSLSLNWSKATDGLRFPTKSSGHIYRADVSSWPRAPELAMSAANQRLPKAHEPDFHVTTPWKYHENYWKAEGVGSSSTQSLKDDLTDPIGSYPDAGTEVGNLKTINGFGGNFLTGARILVKDTYSGHDAYTAIVTSHDPSSGVINLDQSLIYYDGKPLIGANSKYIIEGKSEFLDEEGEWYYDAGSKRLYIWPVGDQPPQTSAIEFAIRERGISITNSSNLVFKNFNVEGISWEYGKSTGPDAAIWMNNNPSDETSNINFDSIGIHNVGIGMRIKQSTNNGKTTNHITLKNSDIGPTDGYGLMIFDYPHTSTTDSGNHHIYLQNNLFHDMGFRPSNGGVGLFFQEAKNVLFENNIVRHTGHNGLAIQGGVQSNILVRNNIFEDNCWDGLDCAGFKTQGGKGPNNILVMNNISRRTRGFSPISQSQNKWQSREGSGFGGFGFYADVVRSSGDTYAALFYRNISYDNSADGIHFTRSRDLYLAQNLIYGNTLGVNLSNTAVTADASYHTVIKNNLIAVPPAFSSKADVVGVSVALNSADRSRLTLDGNSYGLLANSFAVRTNDLNGSNRKTWNTLLQVQQAAPVWEVHGTSVEPFSFVHTSDQTISLQSVPGMNSLLTSGMPAEIVSVKKILEQSLGVTINDSMIVGKQ